MEFKEVHMILLGLESHFQAIIGGYGYPPRATP
jgi:hypothetical protein